MRILNWKNKDRHTCLCFGKFNTPDFWFFCSVPYVTVSVRIIARLARIWVRQAERAKRPAIACNALKLCLLKIWTLRLTHTRCNISRRTRLHTLFEYRFRFLCYCRSDQLSNIETVLHFGTSTKAGWFHLTTTILAIAKKWIQFSDPGTWWFPFDRCDCCNES